ncbi:hypothetical protein Y032_0030g2083 [Ancylostoma ceylanicum]|uniref:Uncharacterized protein n=1 Tax=Ancylostoma ceylanicum TaxID=53326 RepID=A0A016URP1_9BILA|nr:hypothetical protein Y032_0030g2083 [Ancylostoma ceylanicum]
MDTLDPGEYLLEYRRNTEGEGRGKPPAKARTPAKTNFCSKVWGEAAVHAFYSVSCCIGGLYTTSSYNRFHNNLFQDIWMILTFDVLTSVVCCLLTFSAIGFTCFKFSISLDKSPIQGRN